MKKTLQILLLLCTCIALGQTVTTISLTVPYTTDEVFIVGNQESLGNWQPHVIKLEKTGAYQREITLNLTFPAEFKFTRGTWDSEGYVVGITKEANIQLNQPTTNASYVIKHWKDEKLESDQLVLKYALKYLKSDYYPNEERTLRILLPENYDTTKKYPVIYTLDGQNLYELLFHQMAVLQNNSYGDNNVLPECITVAIDNTNRMRDLTPNMGNTNIPLGTYVQHTEIFYKSLIHEIVPFINTNYAVSGFNVLVGHSNAGHFVTQLYLQNNHPFQGVIALSVNDFKGYFQQELPKKLTTDNSSLFFLGYGNKDDEFNALGAYLNKQSITHKHVKIQQYNADHMQLPFTSLVDALKFMFADYKYYDALIDETFNNQFTYKTFETTYLNNIQSKYGISTKIDYDIYYLLNKARDKNNVYVFNKLLDEIDSTNALQLQIRFYAANEFNQHQRAKSYLNQMLLSTDETDKLIFFANVNTQYAHFFIHKLKNPAAFINFVEEAKLKWPEYTLEFNYLILKTIVENRIQSPKKGRYMRYCKHHFKDNRYFTLNDLQQLSSN